jgi:transglutaminase-like putative cysteine protease
MIFSINYVTEYRYPAPVTDSMNALRVRPANLPTQRRRSFAITTTPDARIHEHDDYFGTTVHEFEVAQPHESLQIVVDTEVETSRPTLPPDATWEQLTHPKYRTSAAEFLLASRPIPTEPDVGRLADEVQQSTPHATALAICELIPDRFAYRRGVTYVGSTVEDFLTAGGGVCQDFVHLGLLIFRRLGIAARYCSGYLFAGTSAGTESAELETHAWLEVLLPTQGGPGIWVGLDPTNRGAVGENHVKIGHGRSYSDVPPVKGMFRGPAGSALKAKVSMTVVSGT